MVLRCFQNHSLTLLQTAVGEWTCNKCKQERRGHRLRCHSCDFDVCQDCVQLQSAAEGPEHLHYAEQADVDDNENLGLNENPSMASLEESEADRSPRIEWTHTEDSLCQVHDNPMPTGKDSYRLLVQLCCVSAIEGSDSVLLPVMFYALQRDLGLTLSNLATMTLFQALTQAAIAPVWGVLADRRVLRRKTILVIGCVIQGTCTFLLAFQSNFVLMVLLRAINGAMLACLRPVSVGIVSDVASEENRGKAFGWVQLSMCLGSIVGSLMGTPLSNKTVLGWQGWRFAFLIVGIGAILVGLTIAKVMREPWSAPKPPSEEKSMKGELLRIFRYLRSPTFCVLVIQGCFGCIPWNAFSYNTLFYQLAGLSDVQASLLSSAFQVSSGAGNLLGGFIGDKAAKRCRYHGRPFVAQISVAVGIPIITLQFLVQPESGKFVYYLFLTTVFGLLCTWCGTGVNWPILSEIVSADNRSAIMAFEAALEGSTAAILGNAAVAMLAERVFGYDLQAATSGDRQGSFEDMQALGKAMVATCSFPFFLCFCFYTLLHWSYKRDLERVQREREAEETQEDTNEVKTMVAEYGKNPSTSPPNVEGFSCAVPSSAAQGNAADAKEILPL